MLKMETSFTGKPRSKRYDTIRADPIRIRNPMRCERMVLTLVDLGFSLPFSFAFV